MGNSNKPIITSDDMDLFKRIAKHGFVDMEYVYKFVYAGRKPRTINDRIQQLSRHNYLAIDHTFIPPDYTISYRTGYRIITLASKGLRMMHDLGFDVIDNMTTIRNSSPYRKYHQVQVSTVCDFLQSEYESEKSNWRIGHILNERETYFESIMNQPDALLLFERKDQSDDQKKRYVAVFLEIERSYASVKSLDRKLRSYKHSFSQGLYQKEMNISILSCRILFVAQTQLQLEALRSKIESNESIKSLEILITGYQDITKNPLDNIYGIPKSKEKYKLLSKLK